MQTELKGQIIWFDPNKGYGFIKKIGSDASYFVHVTSLVDKTVYPVPDEQVMFDEAQGKKGIMATNVRRTKG